MVAGGRSARSSVGRPVVVLDQGEADAQHSGLDAILVEARRAAPRPSTDRTAAPARRPPRRARGGRPRRARRRGASPGPAARSAPAASPSTRASLALLQRDQALQRQAMARVARPRDLVEDLRREFVLVALEVHLDQRQAGEDPPGLVVAQAELVGRRPGACRRARRRGRARRRRRPRRPRSPGPARRRRPGRRSGAPSACSSTTSAASSSPAWMWARAVAAWRSDNRPRFGGRPPTASRARCRTADRLQRLAPVLMVLAPRPLDQGGQLAVGVRVGPANPVEPRRCVVGPVQRDQPDQELHHPGRVGLDERRPELVQPQAHGLGRDVGTLRHAHRATESRHGGSARRARHRPSPWRACSAPSTSRRSSSARHARSCAARSRSVPSDASRARRNAPNRWW